MGIDIRLPLGLLFTILGGVLALYGLIAAPAQNALAMGANLNLWWGLVLAVSGSAVLFRYRWEQRAHARLEADR